MQEGKDEVGIGTKTDAWDKVAQQGAPASSSQPLLALYLSAVLPWSCPLNHL